MEGIAVGIDTFNQVSGLVIAITEKQPFLFLLDQGERKNAAAGVMLNLNSAA